MALERIRCRDASGSQEAPLGEAQGGDMVAKQWQNLQLEWPSILASLKLETGNNLEMLKDVGFPMRPCYLPPAWFSRIFWVGRSLKHNFPSDTSHTSRWDTYP